MSLVLFVGFGFLSGHLLGNSCPLGWLVLNIRYVLKQIRGTGHCNLSKNDIKSKLNYAIPYNYNTYFGHV